MRSEETFTEMLFRLCNEIRSAHWSAKKFHSKKEADKEYRLGLALDKLLREENTRRRNQVTATSKAE